MKEGYRTFGMPFWINNTLFLPIRRTKNYEERHQLLLGELEAANEQLAKLREECGEHKYEKRVLKEQVGAVNLVGHLIKSQYNSVFSINSPTLSSCSSLASWCWAMVNTTWI